MNTVMNTANNQGDGVCDTTNGRGINAAHLVYPRDTGTQNIGTTFILAALNSDGSGAGSGGGGGSTPAPAPSGTGQET